MVNWNFATVDPGDARGGRRRWRRGLQVRRRHPRQGQAAEGYLIKVNPIGFRRLRVQWTDGTVSNVSVRSVETLG